MKTRITIEMQQSGQPRPYADHLYVGTIYIEYQTAIGEGPDVGEWKPSPMHEETVKAKYSRCVANWKEKPDWFDMTFVGMKHLGPGLWQVTCKEAYTD